MDLPTIEMEKKLAKRMADDYRTALAGKDDPEARAVIRGYEALAKAGTLISLNQAIAEGGCDEHGRPNLACVRADEKWCVLEQNQDGSGSFYGYGDWGNNSWGPPHRQSRRIISVPEDTMDRGHNFRPSPRDGWHSMVPLVPPPLRPGHHLRNFHILWEAEWQKRTLSIPAPRDPALLKNVGGDLYAVLAVWDLTEIERTVLAGRRMG